MIPIRDTIPCYSLPLVTWVLMGINIIVFVVMHIMPENVMHSFVYQYGMVAARYTHPEWAIHNLFPQDYYLSFFTSMFLHGGWIHIIINMMFLWIFADNIEDRMGRGRFIIFYLLCGLIATYIQFYSNPDAVAPVVGASGAIAGVLGAYFFLYPFARIVIWVPLFFLPIFFEMPAIAFLGFWVIIQLQQATTSVSADVAWWGHLGGFIAGVILFRLFLREQVFDQDELKK